MYIRTWVKEDTQLIEDLIEGKGGAVIVNEYIQGRADADAREALREILDDYYEMKEQSELMIEMENHIEKLERMLDKRNARYMKWDG